MRKLLVTLCLLALFIEISGLVLSVSADKPNEAMVSLLEPQDRKIRDLKTNGYLLLLGFGAAASVDPVQTGLDIWLEAEIDRGRRRFNYQNATRSQLFLPPQTVNKLEPWIGTNPLQELRKEQATLRREIRHYPIFASRYKKWLGMPFEDWGYGHAGGTRFEEMFVAHRTYLGEGFSQGLNTGVIRLGRDLSHWRAVMSVARTLPLKIMAATVVSEDVAILSDILSQPKITPELLKDVHALLSPLSPVERSLRRPIQNEFVVGMNRPSTSRAPVPLARQDQSAKDAAWLTKMAGLHPGTLASVEQSLANSILGIEFNTQRTLNMYAVYYKAVIDATEGGPAPLPKLRDVARAFPRTFVDTLLNPVHEEPAWEFLMGKMLEADARIRLAGMQAMLRMPSGAQRVSTRIALAGSDYYDPFTGLPLMWNAMQQRLYSVGQDGLDDGGDPTFDIAVPTVVTQHGVSTVSKTGKQKGKSKKTKPSRV